MEKERRIVALIVLTLLIVGLSIPFWGDVFDFAEG